MPIVSSLRRLQQDAYRAFLGGSTEPLMPALNGARFPTRVAIAVYQNNARETFRKTLAAGYPVVARLVGESCFRGLASRFMRERPSQSGDLQAFGRDFAEFLSSIYGKSEYRYLVDVARLEWAQEEVLLLSEATPVDAQSVARIPEERLESLRLRLNPASRLIASRFPILSIWRVNQHDEPEPVDLDAGGESVLVARQNQRVELIALDAATFALAVALSEGQTIAETFTGESLNAASLATGLKTLADLKLICGFSVD
jgi:hypothetical protein